MLTALLSVLALGFLLGMRHATDADHVVAVTTIVTQQRSLARAARTGMLWGLGHTTTILLVGGAIVALKLQLTQIPPRLGLSLEFAVAVMLIVLGLLTLAGDDRRVSESTARPITIGFVHGLAGSAAVATLPQVALIPDPLVGGGLPRRVRRGHDRRDDARHGVDRRAVDAGRAPVRRDEPQAAHRVGDGEHRRSACCSCTGSGSWRGCSWRRDERRAIDGGGESPDVAAGRRDDRREGRRGGSGRCSGAGSARTDATCRGGGRAIPYHVLVSGADAPADAGVARGDAVRRVPRRPSPRCTTSRARDRSA